MTRSRLLALLAFVGFSAFFAVMLVKIPRADLSAAILLGLGLAAYDLWTQLGPRRGG
jgi:hypothetical protein